MSTLNFADIHNMMAFLEKPVESDGFHEIIDFMNGNQIRYALTVNPTIYTSYIEQFWATTKAKTVNGERQIQALIDKKKVIITETSIRSDLHLEDAGGTDCLPTATIFEELARMGAKSTAWNEFSCTMASLIICLATNKKFNLSKYIFDAMVKHLDRGVKFLMRKQKKDTIVTQEETQQDDNVPTPSNDPPLGGEDIMQLSELMLLCTNLQKQVLDLEKAKDAQAKEIANLKKKERSIEDIDKDTDVSLVDDTHGRSNDVEMVDTNDLHGDEVDVDMPIGEKQKQSAKEREVDTSVEDSAAPTTIEEITLAQTLIHIKAAKPKVVTTAATTTITTRPKARGVVVQEPNQVALDEDLARNLQAQLEAELKEEERLARKKEEEANIALIESWDNTQAMMEADFELAQRL
ncbi:hypothetical protein Tco_0150247 [Tanacetum coccineum]